MTIVTNPGDFSGAQVARASWTVLVRILDTLVAKKLISADEMSVLLKQAAKELEGEAHIPDYGRAAVLVQTVLVPRFPPRHGGPNAS
jgi:hypothetical protein